MTDEGDYLAQAEELERAILELPGVHGAHVDADESGIKSVRVLVVPERSPSAARQDIRAMATLDLGIILDPDQIEILHVGEGEDVSESDVGLGQRRKLSALTISRGGDRFQVQVILEGSGKDILLGEAEARVGSYYERRAVARAILQGTQKLLEEGIDLQSVDVVQVGTERVVLVSIARPAGFLVGSASVRVDEHEAVARATLCALNRFLGTFSKPSESHAISPRM